MGLKRCAQSKPETDQDIVIIGDSHGEHLFIGLADSLRDLNVVYYSFRCLPFIDVMGHPSCQDMQNALKTITASKSIKIVVIASSWPGKLRPEAGFRLSGKDFILEPDQLLKEGLSTTVGALVASKKKILVVGDNPSYGFHPTTCIKSRPFGTAKQPQCAQSKERYVAEHKTSWNGIESVVSQHSNAAFLNIESLFCNEISCSMRFGEIFLYRDRHHLSVEGSWLAGGEVARKLKSLGWVN